MITQNGLLNQKKNILTTALTIGLNYKTKKLNYFLDFGGVYLKSKIEGNGLNNKININVFYIVLMQEFHIDLKHNKSKTTTFKIVKEYKKMFFPLKNIVTVLFLSLFYVSISFSQEKKSIGIDEVKINLNLTDSSRLLSFTPKFGFGVGVYHTFRKEKTMNFLVGVEYNLTQYTNASYIPEGSNILHSQHKDSISIVNHSITFPLLFRFNIKKNFIKIGVLPDFNIKIYEKGTLYTTDVNVNDSTSTFSSANYKTSFNTGPSFGSVIGIGRNFTLFSKHWYSSINYSFFFNFNSSYYKRASSFDISLGLKF